MEQQLSVEAREIADEAHATCRLGRELSAERQRAERCTALASALKLQVKPLASDDDYAALAAKHLDIATKRSKIERELRDTISAIARGMVAHRDRQIEQQAQSLIDGKPMEAFHGFEEMRARQSRLQEEARVYGEAIRILRAQMEELRGERSIDAAEAAASVHRQAVARIAEACAMLEQALDDESTIREIVTGAGYDARLPDFGGYSRRRLAAGVGMPRSELEHAARGYVG